MPRAFTTDEAAIIRSTLLGAGAACFARSGIRRTTVDELARAAGISKGAFYKFFPTKESLFLTLIEDYETSTHAEIEAAVREDPGGGLEVLIDAALRATEQNPLLPVAMSDEGLALMRHMSDAEREAFVLRDVHLIDRILRVLSEAGVAVNVPANVLVGLLRALVFVGWHRREVGEDLVDELAGWLTPTLRAAMLGGPAPSGGSDG
ncbi:MAG: TetR/AcrR family transcriptional regulator [Dactylosporangium sp.]|nr:TetR/AcrR family transcriptional regulator [Dactylosporangium sp.]NNJ60508.1 TetR/AcrR family transcriptional regulator [Dactylosporangium sp.]